MTKLRKDNKLSKIELEKSLQEAKKPKLSPEWAEFCYYYTLKDCVTYGNATLSYSMAYGKEIPKKEDGTLDTKSSEYTVCQVAGSRLSGHPTIVKQVEAIMLERLKDTTVDARLSSIIHAGKDADSIQGIKIYNDLKGRITKNLNVNVSARPLENISDEELERIANGEN